MKKGTITKWVKRIIIIGAVGVAAFVFLNPKPEAVVLRSTKADRGDIKIIVSGTGTVATTEARKEISTVTAKVKNIYYDEGDYVKEGAVIARLDDSDYAIQINNQKNTIAQAKISQGSTQRQIENLKIISTGEGFIRNLAIKEGSYVVTNSKVSDITIPNRYEITLQFLASTASRINVGDAADVFMLDSYSHIDGVVTYVGSEKSILSTGSNVVDVIITIEDPRYVLDGLKAEATIKTVSGIELTSSEPSYFESAKDSQILSGSTGKVVKLFVKDGQEIHVGDVIAELENEDLNDSVQNTDISIANLQQQLNYSQSKLSDYVIKSDISGTITSQNIKVGDWVQAGSIVSTISDMDTFEFKIPVDELEISKVKLDSPVSVTVEALEQTLNNPITGEVSKLPLEGVSAGGVTDYYVTIKIPYVDGLLIGMNADADIIIKESLNVVRIPIECVEKENGKYYVQIVEGSSGDKLTKREVEVGIKDSNYYEITSGLQEGEAVFVPEQGISGATFNMF